MPFWVIARNASTKVRWHSNCPGNKKKRAEHGRPYDSRFGCERSAVRFRAVPNLFFILQRKDGMLGLVFMTASVLLDDAIVVGGPSIDIIRIVDDVNLNMVYDPPVASYGELDAQEVERDILQLKRAIVYLADDLNTVYMHSCACVTLMIAALITFMCCTTCRRKSQRPLTAVVVDPPPNIEPLQLQQVVKV